MAPRNFYWTDRVGIGEMGQGVPGQGNFELPVAKWTKKAEKSRKWKQKLFKISLEKAWKGLQNGKEEGIMVSPLSLLGGVSPIDWYIIHRISSCASPCAAQPRWLTAREGNDALSFTASR